MSRVQDDKVDGDLHLQHAFHHATRLLVLTRVMEVELEVRAVEVTGISHQVQTGLDHLVELFDSRHRRSYMRGNNKVR